MVVNFVGHLLLKSMEHIRSSCKKGKMQREKEEIGRFVLVPFFIIVFFFFIKYDLKTFFQNRKNLRVRFSSIYTLICLRPYL